jgi:predicted ATPase
MAKEFILSVIRILPKCDLTLCKTLKLGDYFLNDRCVVIQNKVELSEQKPVMKNFFGTRISIQAIVGQNGSGKSSLLEIIYRVVNNLSCLLERGENRRAAEQLYYVDELWAELYYVIDGKLGCITCQGDTVRLMLDHETVVTLYAFDDSNGHKASKVLMDDFRHWTHNLFYTIVTNYSIQSFIDSDYECENCFVLSEKNRRQNKEKAISINGLFHKNDGYMTPIVLNPFRHGGIIDIKKEHRLTIYRLSSVLIHAKKHNRQFLSDYELFDMRYTFNRSIVEDKYCETYKINKDKVWNYRYNLSNNTYADVILRAFGYKNINMDDDLQRCAALYLIYKTFSIANKYPNYNYYEKLGNLNNFLKPTSQFIDDYIKGLVEKINKDKSHITLKIRQVKRFLNTCINGRIDTNEVLLNDFTYEDYLIWVNPQKELTKMREIQEYLPPSFFTLTIRLKSLKEGDKEKEPIPVERLSSGERQYLYTFNTYIYHILNLLSIQESSRVRYRNFNLILDEVEICFHPEFQRRFIDELISFIQRLKLNQYASINIIIATHSPFILSDIPTSNILYMDEGKMLDGKNFRNPYCANINDVLYQSFFLKNGFIGENAKKKLKRLISKINKYRAFNQTEIKDAEELIEIIGDPFIKMQMTQMLQQKKELCKKL